MPSSLMAPESIVKRLGWGPRSSQQRRLESAAPRLQAEAQRQAQQDREIARRGEALLRIIQSPEWWAVKAVFDETFTEILDSLTGPDDLSANDVLTRLGGLRVTRALYESFDADLRAGDGAFQRLTGGGRLVFVSAAETQRPIPVAKQPLT